MNDRTAIEFALRGKTHDRDFSPVTGVPMSRWLEFNREVQDFVQGSDSSRLFNDLEVQIVPGSYLVRVLGAVTALSAAADDLVKLTSPDALGRIDPKRASVVRSWSERSHQDPSLTYVLRTADPKIVEEPSKDGSIGTTLEVVISAATEFSEPAPEVWFDTEFYLVGKIENWGGTDSVNIHLRPRDAKKLLTIKARPEQIAAQRENLVYHQAIVHVTARENLRTGEINDHTLLDLRPYQPNVSPEKLEALFAKGAAAWNDVDQPGAWVEELRGGRDV